MTSKKILNSQGFTLIEIIAALIIVGILTSVAVSRASSQDTYAQYAEYNALKSHIRYAQGLALRTETNWSIQFNSDNSYQLMMEVPNSTNTPTARTFPGESSETVQLTALAINTSLTITFDSLGRAVVSSIAPASDLFIDTGYKLITFTADTGFIQ